MTTLDLAGCPANRNRPLPIGVSQNSQNSGRHDQSQIDRAWGAGLCESPARGGAGASRPWSPKPAIPGSSPGCPVILAAPSPATAKVRVCSSRIAAGAVGVQRHRRVDPHPPPQPGRQLLLRRVDLVRRRRPRGRVDPLPGGQRAPRPRPEAHLRGSPDTLGSDHLPFRLVNRSLVLSISILLFVLGRRRVGDWLAVFRRS